MRRYFWRQVSSLWFDRYLMICGAALNVLAFISLLNALVPAPAHRQERRDQRARIELENGERCDQLMANTEFAPGREFSLKLADGAPIQLSYKHQGTYGRTQEGHAIHMIEMSRTGLLFFEVDEKNMIRRCIPNDMLECVAAAGSFEKNGTCVVSVNLPSDCQVMKGELNGQLCRVPPHTRILKASRKTAAR